MNCRDIENNVLFYAENELSAETKALFELHIAGCKHCALLCENIKATVFSVETVQHTEEDFYFYTRLKQRMENEKLKQANIKFIPKRILQPIAITVLIGIGIFTGIKIGSQFNATKLTQTTEETRTSQLDTYSEETYIADINNKQLETLYTSNQ